MWMIAFLALISTIIVSGQWTNYLFGIGATVIFAALAYKIRRAKEEQGIVFWLIALVTLTFLIIILRVHAPAFIGSIFS